MVVTFSTQTTVNTTQALIEVWETLEPRSCPYHYNFHLHTLFSDGRLTPDALIEQAVSIGLKGLAITDHHSVKGYYRALS
ncbi:MAG: PHP domain-containing protein, partial [Snowella sp.]